MLNQNSNLKSLLSPARSGTFFAPFRSRSANPDGFDSKMKLWISAIEEWAVINKKLTISLKDIHQTFVSDTGIRPDKECIRLVFSEMKRRSRLVPLNTLKTSNIWSSPSSLPLLSNLMDPKGWLSWGVTKLVYNPASWAISTIASGQDQGYSDLIDMSIPDTMKFVSQRSLNELSEKLLMELVRISEAENQFCFEWKHLLDFITPALTTIIDSTDGKELLEIYEILTEYLAANQHVAIQIDNDSKLVKVANPGEDNVIITQKDIAMARLLRAKELLTVDSNKYHNQALRAKQEALESYGKKEIAKAKSLLRSHKRLTACAEQKDAQLTNVEIMLDQLENTDSNMMIIQAYKDGADALRIANTNLESNTSILDEMYDVTAEARQLNEEMNQMMRDISCVSQGIHDISYTDLEEELNEYITEKDKSIHPTSKTRTADQSYSADKNESNIDNELVDELQRRLDSLVVCQDEPICQPVKESNPKTNTIIPSTAT